MFAQELGVIRAASQTMCALGCYSVTLGMARTSIASDTESSP